MDPLIQLLLTRLRAGLAQLRERPDAGMTTIEVAILVGALVAIASILVVALNSKVQQKIGLIN